MTQISSKTNIPDHCFDNDWAPPKPGAARWSAEQEAHFEEHKRRLKQLVERKRDGRTAET
jgi:hypothetical protein